MATWLINCVALARLPLTSSLMPACTNLTEQLEQLHISYPCAHRANPESHPSHAGLNKSICYRSCCRPIPCPVSWHERQRWSLSPSITGTLLAAHILAYLFFILHTQGLKISFLRPICCLFTQKGGLAESNFGRQHRWQTAFFLPDQREVYCDFRLGTMCIYYK